MSTFSSPEHWLTDPLAIGSALNELLRSTETVEVSRGAEPLPSLISAVNTRARTFRFRPYGGDTEFEYLAGATELQFRGAAYGAQIEFPVDGHVRQVTPIEDDSLERPVFEADFPVHLYRLQRREFFRARVAPPNTRLAVWSAPGGGDIRFRIQDVSLAGVGMRSTLGADALPKPGDELRGIILDFNEFGIIRADVRVVATRCVTEFDMRQGKIEYTHLGCEFVKEDMKRENFLQKLVYQLEQASRA